MSHNLLWTLLRAHTTVTNSYYGGLWGQSRYLFNLCFHATMIVLCLRNALKKKKKKFDGVNLSCKHVLRCFGISKPSILCSLPKDTWQAIKWQNNVTVKQNMVQSKAPQVGDQMQSCLLLAWLLEVKPSKKVGWTFGSSPPATPDMSVVDCRPIKLLQLLLFHSVSPRSA